MTDKYKDTFFGKPKGKDPVTNSTGNLVKGVVTLAVALPLLGATTSLIGGLNK